MSSPRLSRRLSRPVLVGYGAGAIIGAGIYVLIGEVAGQAGPLALWSFLLAAALAGVTAVSYAALAPAFPEAAGEAAYLREAFGVRWITTSIGLLLALTGIVSAGVLARGFEGYLSEFVSPPGWVVIGAVILLLGALAGAGVRVAAGAAVAITCVEVAGLLFVLLLSRSAWGGLPDKLPSMVFPEDAAAWLGVGTGTVLAFYAFIGFEDLVNMAEEARSPERDLPFAIYGSLLFATALYVLVGAAALLSLDPRALAESDAPLADVVRAHGGPAWAVSVVSLIAVLNGALVQIVMASRVLYGLSRRGSLPAWLGRVNKRTRSPIRATALVVLLSLSITLFLPINRLAEITSLGLLVVFASVNAAALKLRSNRSGVSIAPVWPVLGLISCSAVVVFRLASYAT